MILTRLKKKRLRNALKKRNEKRRKVAENNKFLKKKIRHEVIRKRKRKCGNG